MQPNYTQPVYACSMGEWRERKDESIDINLDYLVESSCDQYVRYKKKKKKKKTIEIEKEQKTGSSG